MLEASRTPNAAQRVSFSFSSFLQSLKFDCSRCAGMQLVHSTLRRLLALLALLAAFAEDCAREKPPPKYDTSEPEAAPLEDVPVAELGLLPDELLEEIIKHLLPESGLQDKPVDAIRFGSTCRHLHDLVLPLAFQVCGMLNLRHDVD